MSEAMEESSGARPLLIRGGLSPGAVRRVARTSKANWLARRPGTSDAAAIAEPSLHHFSRAFKHSTGLPHQLWLVDRSVEIAALAIAMLAKIAVAPRFSPQQQAATAFRRVAGIALGAWRRARAANVTSAPSRPASSRT
jgi:AraC family transcriptional regulator